MIKNHITPQSQFNNFLHKWQNNNKNKKFMVAYVLGSSIFFLVRYMGRAQFDINR
jgi:hypothetical protein